MALTSRISSDALRAWARKRRRRITWWLGGISAVLLIYTLAGFFWVPVLARDWIQAYVTERLQRHVSIGEIRFNPYTLTARVTDFQLTEADGAPLAAFAHLLVNAQLSSLFTSSYRFAEIRLESPAIDTVIDPSGSLNLARLVPDQPEVAAEQQDALPEVRIDALQVLDGRLSLEDQTRSTPFRVTVTPVQFALADFRTTMGFQNAYRFSGVTAAGEQLDWSGQFTLQPLGSNGIFAVRNLRATTVWAYVQDQVRFALPSGQIDLQGNYALSVNGQNATELSIQLPQIQLSNLAIAPIGQTGTEPWISLPKVSIDNTRFSLSERLLSIERLAFADPQLEAWREADGTLNLAQLVRTTQSDTAASSSSAASWRAEIANVEVNNGRANVTDRGVEPAVSYVLAPIAITATQLSTDGRQPVNIATDIGINETGHLQAEGSIQLHDLTTELDVEATDIPLPALQPYLDRTTDMTLDSGRFSLNGRVTYANGREAEQPRLGFSGRVDVADFSSRDRLVNQDFIVWELLSATGIDYSLNPARLSIERIYVREPYARVVISQDARLNVRDVLNIEASEPGDDERGRRIRTDAANNSPAKTAAATDTLPVNIDTVAVENGSANFADYSLQPSFASGIQALSGSVRGLSSNASSRAKVDLKGRVDEYSPVVIAGEVNLLSAAVYTDLAMNFSNMELTTFNPYSGKFAGYNIARGKLTTELTYKVNNRELDAQHHIVVDQLEFGAATASKDAVPIPIKLAVALLKDRNGVIDINLPVQGNLDDPSFRLGPIIWQAFVGLLTKVVTAPFALIGSLFGGGDDLAYIDFAPGSAQLTPESAAKLSTLGKALAERPQLNLDIPLNVVTSSDTDSLAQQAVAATLPADSSAPDEVAGLKERLRALTDALRKTPAGVPNLPTPATTTVASNGEADPDLLRTQANTLEQTLKERLAPSPQQLDALARARADVVRSALLGNPDVAPERVFLTTRELSEQPSPDHVRMELKLE